MALSDAGLRWDPAVGDRFSMLNPAFEGEVFTLSDMTIEPQGPPGARVLGFNGTTEWALDSIEQEAVVWLPREGQLRELLGAAFVRLEQVTGGYAVTATSAGGVEGRFVDIDAERAYARALLARLSTPR